MSFTLHATTARRPGPGAHRPARGGLAAQLAALVVASLAAALVAWPPVPARAAIGARRVAGGLDRPVAFTFDPRGRIWYLEKDTGEVRILRPGAGDRRFSLVPGVNGEGERGTLGIALHPRYPDRPFIYVYATREVGGGLRNQILRLTDLGGRGGRMRVLFSAPASSSPYHNGGRILFGLDGMLYAVIGDAHDPANAQQLGDRRGKVLRMTPSGGVPPDNPLGDRLAYAFGIRNSFGLAFDPRTGALWETENGPECNDELNLILPGENYGWGPSETCAGEGPANTNRDGSSPELPVLWWEVPVAPTGIAFCDGCRLGARSEGALFFGAANTGDVRRVVLNAARDGAIGQRVVYSHPNPVLSVEVGPDGRIYFSDFGGIFALVRRSEPGRTGRPGLRRMTGVHGPRVGVR